MEPLDPDLPDPEIEYVKAPVRGYPAEMTCRQCGGLMVSLTWPENSRFRCFPCDRLIEIVLPEKDDEPPELFP